MTDTDILIAELTDKISARLDAGFTPDIDSLHFLKTSYGVNDGDELLSYLDDSILNDGTIYELVVYPDDEFRFEIEKIIPAEGIPRSMVAGIQSSIDSISRPLELITSAGRHLINTDLSRSCASSFITRLNLETDLGFMAEEDGAAPEELNYRGRAFLRKKKFIPSEDRGDFFRRLLRYKHPVKRSDDDLLKLAETAAQFLSGTSGKAFDTLAAKKYYYESVISQADEYAALLKSWGMEFLMMKRIQPPPVSVDEALESIRTIDRITSIVYGLIIPPSDMAVQMRINRDDAASDIFR